MFDRVLPEKYCADQLKVRVIDCFFPPAVEFDERGREACGVIKFFLPARRSRGRSSDHSTGHLASRSI
jgi:hypothetical protein